eukprot:CAMPEP_0170453280 /NCGR_PEP_ID=MMETSP0123-20130129/1910_1 /TAXON_ID=182087 /ORGANISM="Favella ehrenbergii, Strain Fehren 1" /LENGTH=61 /DNA_ID=CAMNT_0010715591 /DNA_START=232 /DNA_END=417 /DNA_ORIENTATION=+
MPAALEVNVFAGKKRQRVEVDSDQSDGAEERRYQKAFKKPRKEHRNDTEAKSEEVSAPKSK